MSSRDTQVQLNDLEEEEARIMRELRDLDEKAQAETEAKRRRQQIVKDDPETALSQLLLECEKEVRDAKGYIADNGPPLKIVRVRHGETAPKGATYLSRPRNTGVDFTVPLTTKVYTDIVKKPIFLNQMRDKMKTKEYTSSEDYLEDMRLLARNTAAFNKGPELSWVVQHARFLLEAAEDAVTARRRDFYEVEDALRQQNINRPRAGTSLHSVGKRKRPSGGGALETNGDAKGLPSIGTMIEVYWPNYRKWFAATIQASQGANVHVVYEEDSTDQWVNLEHGVKWRIKPGRGAASTKSKRTSTRHVEPPASKKRKASAAASHHDTTSVAVAGGATIDDFNSMSTDMRSMMSDLRENLTARLIRHVETLDRTLHRSDHLQRILLAVDDTRNEMQTFMEQVDKRCSRIEELLSKLTGTGSQPPEDGIDKADRSPVQENHKSLNKENKAEKAVEVAERGESAARAAEPEEEVIEIDDASTDKPDEVQVMKSGKADTSRPVEEKVLVERDHTASEKNAKTAEAKSIAEEAETKADANSAMEASDEDVSKPGAPHNGADSTAPETRPESTAKQTEADFTTGKKKMDGEQDQEKPEAAAEPENDTEPTSEKPKGKDEPRGESPTQPAEKDTSHKGEEEKTEPEEQEKQTSAPVGEPEKRDEHVSEGVDADEAHDANETTSAGKGPAPKARKGLRDLDERKREKEDDESSDGSDGSDDSEGSESEGSSDGDETEANAKKGAKDGKAKAGKKPLATVERKSAPDEEEDAPEELEDALAETKDAKDADEEEEAGERAARPDRSKKDLATPQDSEMAEAEATPEKGGEKKDDGKEEEGDGSGSDMDVDPAS